MQQASTSPSGNPSRPPRTPPRPVLVSQIRQLTPHMIRVTVTGEALADYPTPGPASHLKLFFPKLSEERPVNRTYTPRRWDPMTGELDIDLLVHGTGIGSTWASEARIGEPAAVGRAGGSYELDPAVERLLIAGDDSALPAIGTLVEALPASVEARVFIEVENADEEQELASRARMDLTWLHRGDRASVGSLLEAAIRDSELSEGSGKVWVACEASIMRNIRTHLLHERGLARESIHTQGYWKSGETNHPDHDMGKEIL
jgi:NADPH-dependent ferric siderophore reductase